MGPGRDDTHRAVVDVRYERRKVLARHAEADEARRICAGDTEIPVRAAEKHGFAVTERDFPLALKTVLRPARFTAKKRRALYEIRRQSNA